MFRVLIVIIFELQFLSILIPSVATNVTAGNKETFYVKIIWIFEAKIY
jgi:hypothetical protein